MLYMPSTQTSNAATDTNDLNTTGEYRGLAQYVCYFRRFEAALKYLHTYLTIVFFLGRVLLSISILFVTEELFRLEASYVLLRSLDYGRMLFGTSHEGPDSGHYA